jgi:hypothetical protein
MSLNAKKTSKRLIKISKVFVEKKDVPEKKDKDIKDIDDIEDIADLIEDNNDIADTKNKSDTKLIKKSQIISASRRTDIPAFYMKEIVQSMLDGHIFVTNQYGTTTNISLSPDDVKCYVWWSKDYKNWLEEYKTNKKLFSKTKHMFNFTITGGDNLEKGVRSTLDERLDQVKELSELFGAESIKYRFDPIVVYVDIKTKERKDNLEHFTKIIKTISNYGVKDIIIAFCIPYKKVCSRMKKRGKMMVDLSIDEKKEILDKLIKITDKYNMKIFACCSSGIIGYKNKIFPSKCVDGGAIEKILDEPLTTNIKDKGQREECNCAVSKDIGSYSMKCGHSCDYCYANPE